MDEIGILLYLFLGLKFLFIWYQYLFLKTQSCQVVFALVMQCQGIGLRPGQTLATFQRNVLQHCCMMLRHVLNGVAKCTQQTQHVDVYVPQAPVAQQVDVARMPLCINFAWSWPFSSPEAASLSVSTKNNDLWQQRVQLHATFKMLHEKFDRFQIWSNIIQHVVRNGVAKRMQHVVSNNVARRCVDLKCWECLDWPL